jgi:hypothetical protein
MTQDATSEQKKPVSVLDVVGFFVDLAMFLPCNKAVVPPKFRELLARHHVTQAGTGYIGRIDHKHVLSPNERTILTEEGTYYLLVLQYYYVAQMLNKTSWQINVEPDDPRLIPNTDIFSFYTGRLEKCLQALGVEEEYAYDAQWRFVVESERYRRKGTWAQAQRAGHLYPPLSKLMRTNMAKRIVMTDAKREVIDKYSSKIHGDASKFYRKLEKDYRYVGIRHFEVS